MFFDPASERLKCVEFLFVSFFCLFSDVNGYMKVVLSGKETKQTKSGEKNSKKSRKDGKKFA
jgi:hypothetical protein